MPHYRIVIWTKRRKQPFTVIRLIADLNINAVYQGIQSRANDTYRQDLIDIEVQMLYKLCKAIQKFEKNILIVCNSL